MKEAPVINMNDFKEVNDGDKLNLLMVVINKINTNFHHKFDALSKLIMDDKDGILLKITAMQKVQEEVLVRLEDLESDKPTIKQLIDRIDSLEQQNARLTDDLAVIKGLVQVHDNTIVSQNKKLVDLSARSMANNIVISGLTGDEKEENCKNKVLEFMTENMKMMVEPDEVEVAHRLGNKDPKMKKDRPMVIRCRYSLCDRIFQFTKNLKSQKNNKSESYFVHPQLPEPLQTERKEHEEKYRSIRKANAEIPDDQKDKRTLVHIKNKTLYVNNVPQKQHIYPPPPPPPLPRIY